MVYLLVITFRKCQAFFKVFAPGCSFTRCAVDWSSLLDSWPWTDLGTKYSWLMSKQPKLLLGTFIIFFKLIIYLLQNCTSNFSCRSIKWYSQKLHFLIVSHCNQNTLHTSTTFSGPQILFFSFDSKTNVKGREKYKSFILTLVPDTTFLDLNSNDS